MNNTQYLLGKLAEEASEVAHIALKAQGFGTHSAKSGEGETKNIDHILQEFTDLKTVLHQLFHHIGCSAEVTAGACNKKIEKLKKFHKVSVDLGQVSDPGGIKWIEFD